MQFLNRLIQASSALAIVPAILFAVAPPMAFSTEVPEQLKEVGIVEHLGSSVLPQDPKFKDETGQEVHFSDYFKSGRPVMLVLAYYECPNLCTFVLNGMVDSLKKLDWVPGKEFEVVTLSINPKETPVLAALKKKAYMANYGKPEAAAGWHFLTGQESEIRKLSNAVGFNYKWDPEEKQYAHSAAIYTLTPDGRISRYLYGIEFKPNDVKLALLEASNGKIGTVIERFLLFCYHYDPHTRKYSIYVTRLVQTGCAGTVVVFGSYLAVFWRKERRINKESDTHA